MKEIFEFRINYNFATRLFSPEEGKNLGDSVKVIQITREDPRFFQIPILHKEIGETFNRGFFYGWDISHQYTKIELEKARLFYVRLKSVFEPAGEVCGTEYDESVACEICGVNRRQIGALKLKKAAIPKKDIAFTIAGEVIVSEKFKDCFRNHHLKGLEFEPVLSGDKVLNVYQPRVTSSELILTENTIAGINPFNFSESEGGEIYKCPKGHTIGLNLLSEVYLEDSPEITQQDFFATKQKVGVNRGLLRPQSLYVCSPPFRQMVIKEKLSGFDFEVAHVDK